MSKEKVYYVIGMLFIIGLLLFQPIVAEAKNDPPLPYTTPKISYQGKTVRISWYNTQPKVYTVVERTEICDTKRCMLKMRIVYKKFLGIGNIRINDKTKTKVHGQYIVY